eukprot:g638.t1
MSSSTRSTRSTRRTARSSAAPAAAGAPVKAEALSASASIVKVEPAPASSPPESSPPSSRSQTRKSVTLGGKQKRSFAPSARRRQRSAASDVVSDASAVEGGGTAGTTADTTADDAASAPASSPPTAGRERGRGRGRGRARGRGRTTAPARVAFAGVSKQEANASVRSSVASSGRFRAKVKHETITAVAAAAPAARGARIRSAGQTLGSSGSSGSSGGGAAALSEYSATYPMDIENADTEEDEDEYVDENDQAGEGGSGTLDPLRPMQLPFSLTRRRSQLPARAEEYNPHLDAGETESSAMTGSAGAPAASASAPEPHEAIQQLGLAKLIGLHDANGANANGREASAETDFIFLQLPTRLPSTVAQAQAAKARADNNAAHDATKPKPEPSFSRQRMQLGRNDPINSQPRHELSAQQQDSIRQHARSRAQAFLERERTGRGLSAIETKKRRTELERQIRMSAGRNEAFVDDELKFEDDLHAHIKKLFEQKKLSESALVDAVQGWAIQRSRSRVHLAPAAGEVSREQLKRYIAEVENSVRGGVAGELKPSSFHDNTWSQLPAGTIGKLRLRQSGKVELLLGDTTMIVNPGIEASFVQDVVCMSEKKESFCHLGGVRHRVVCTPDFESMLRDK